MEETVKKQETVTSFKPVRKRSEKQIAWSKQLGKQSQMLKKKKKERLEQDLQDRTSSQALPDQQSKADVATIEEIEEPIKQDRTSSQAKPDQTAIYFGFGLAAIIGFGAYYWYSRKPKEKVEPKETVEPKEKVEPVKSGIINME